MTRRIENTSLVVVSGECVRVPRTNSPVFARQRVAPIASECPRDESAAKIQLAADAIHVETGAPMADCLRAARKLYDLWLRRVVR